MRPYDVGKPLPVSSWASISINEYEPSVHFVGGGEGICQRRVEILTIPFRCPCVGGVGYKDCKVALGPAKPHDH